MDNMLLHLDQIDYDASSAAKGFGIWGVLYVEIGGKCFPSSQWWDVASSVLDMWQQSLIAFSQGQADRCDLFFMDGPYQINLIRQDNGSVSAHFLKRGDPPIMEFAAIDFPSFIASVTACKEKLLRTISNPTQ